MIRALLLLIAIAAVALPAWGVVTYTLPPAPAFIPSKDPGSASLPGKVEGEPSSAQIANWQKLANRSCKCARRGGKSSECWAEYDRETAAYAKGDWATMCMPISHSGDCFGSGTGLDKCVETDRDHAGQLLCSAEERTAMEAAWNRELAAPHGESDAETARAFDRAGAAMRQVYQRILRGESLAGIKGPPGCGGGLS